MLLSIVILIMLFMGIFGGLLNFLLPANLTEVKKAQNKNAENSTTDNSLESEVKNKRRRNSPLIECIILGIGATLLVPLFLEIAQSKILDDIRMPGHDIVKKEITKPLTNDSVTIFRSTTGKDSIIRKQSTKSVTEAANSNELKNPVKTYFLFASYCLLAAAAGLRFINNLIDGVLKDKQIKTLKEEKEQVTDEKKKIEKAKNKIVIQNRVSGELEEKKALTAARTIDGISNFTAARMEIGPVTHPDDPQKGRFGGKREMNFRKLDATVIPSIVPGLFEVTIWVESTDQKAHPLNTDVIFYVHDSFRHSVQTIKFSDIEPDGKIKWTLPLAYGAFTVGAVTDNGLTMLEYDLAEDNRFPETFRSR